MPLVVLPGKADFISRTHSERLDYQKLLRGAKNKQEFTQLSQLLKGLSYLAVHEDFWERLSEFSFQLFRKGLVVPLTDSYIALLCIENQASILHRDKHYDMIAQKTKLKILQ